MIFSIQKTISETCDIQQLPNNTFFFGGGEGDGQTFVFASWFFHLRSIYMEILILVLYIN